MAERAKRNILYLNSYHDGYPWSDNELEGIRSVLNETEFTIDLQIEYLDSKRYSYQDTKDSLFSLYQKKFDKEAFDIIITSDNNALKFVEEFRETLFPGVPVVFCGINDIAIVPSQCHNITGIIENFNPMATFDIAKKLHPERKKVIIFDGDPSADHTIAKQIITKLRDSQYPLEIEYWGTISLEENMKRIENLPQDAFLFVLPWYQREQGTLYTSQEIMTAISEKSEVPIYTSWNFLLGSGTVGGKMISGYQHGREAATLTLRILRGEEAKEIPIREAASGKYSFDYNILQKLGINKNLLPPNAIIINNPDLFYKLPRELFWTIVISCVLLVIALITSLVSNAQRRRVERQALEQLSFQETLLDTIPQLISWKNVDGIYLGGNRSFSEFFGVKSPEAISSKETNELIADKAYTRWSRHTDIQVANEAKPLRKVRKKCFDATGEEHCLEVSKVPLLDQDGEIVGILNTAENITKEQDLERQLIQSQKMEAIGTLAGGIAHDFNNILTSIINSTELAMDDIPSGSQTEKDLQRVLRAARRGSRVVKQMLSFSRPSSEGFRPTKISTIINEVKSLIEASLPSTITMTVHIAQQDALVHGDATQIHQVLLNLCANASHAMRDKGGILELSQNTIQINGTDNEKINLTPGNYVQLTIKDSGHGIAPDIIDKIFDPFFSTKDITEGSGLGLSVVNGIIKGHKGGLTVNSSPEQGTTFEIYLPQGKERRKATRKPENTAPTTTFSLLFVEDDEDQLNSVPRMLRKMGHRVTALQDPAAAIALAEQAPQDIDIIITDYDMPTMTGTQLAETLDQFPVILVSGRKDAIHVATSDNIVRVLIKPYDQHDLQAVLSNIQRRRKTP